MVKKVVNPNIIRITNNENWKSKYFEKKASDLPSYSIRDAKIRDFIRKFFKKYKMTVNTCELYHKNRCVEIVLSYWQNLESIHTINEIKKTKKVILKKNIDKKLIDICCSKSFPKRVKKKSCTLKYIYLSARANFKSLIKQSTKLKLNKKVKYLFFELNQLKRKTCFVSQLMNKSISYERNRHNAEVLVNKLFLKSVLRASVKKIIEKDGVKNKKMLKNFIKVICLKYKDRRRLILAAEKEQTKKVKVLEKKYIKKLRENTTEIYQIKCLLENVRRDIKKILENKLLNQINLARLTEKSLNSVKKRLLSFKKIITISIKKQSVIIRLNQSKKTSYQILTDRINLLKIKKLKQIIFKHRLINLFQKRLQFSENPKKDVEFIIESVGNLPQLESRKIISYFLNNDKLRSILKRLQRNVLASLVRKQCRKYTLRYFLNFTRKSLFNSADFFTRHLKTINNDTVSYFLTLTYFLDQQLQKTSLTTDNHTYGNIMFFVKKNWQYLQKTPQKCSGARKKIEAYIKAAKKISHFKKRIKESSSMKKQIKKFLKVTQNIKGLYKQLKVLFKQMKTKNAISSKSVDVYKNVCSYFLELNKIRSFKFIKFFKPFLLNTCVITKNAQFFFVYLQKLKKIFPSNKSNLKFANRLKNIQKTSLASRFLTIKSQAKFTKASWATIQKRFNRKSKENFACMKQIYAHCFIRAFVEESSYILKQTEHHSINNVKNSLCKKLYVRLFKILQQKLKKQISRHIKKSYKTYFRNKKHNLKSVYSTKLGKPRNWMKVKQVGGEKRKIFLIPNIYVGPFLKKMQFNVETQTEYTKILDNYWVAWVKCYKQREIKESREKNYQRMLRVALKYMLARGRVKVRRRRLNRMYRRDLKSCRKWFRGKHTRKKRRPQRRVLEIKANLKNVALENSKLRFVVKTFVNADNSKSIFSLKNLVKRFSKRSNFIGKPLKWKRHLKKVNQKALKRLYRRILSQKKSIRKYVLRFEYISAFLRKKESKWKRRKKWINFKIKKKMKKKMKFRLEKSRIKECKKLLKQSLNYKKLLESVSDFSKKYPKKSFLDGRLYTIISKLQKKIAKKKIEVVNNHKKHKKCWEYQRKLCRKLHLRIKFRYNRLTHRNSTKKKVVPPHKKFVSFLNKNLKFFFFKKKKKNVEKLKVNLQKKDAGKILNTLKKKKYQLKNNRIKSLSGYKKVISMENNANFNDFESNSFFERLFESLSKFLKYREDITLILQPLNKESKKTLLTGKSKVKFTKGSVSKFFRYKRQTYFKEGFNIFLFCMTHKNSANLLSEFLATQLQRIRKYLNYFVKFVKNSLLQFTRPEYLPVTLGVKVQIKGRFNRAPRARKKTIKIGLLPILTLKSEVAYSEKTAYTKDGTFGIKVWIVYK